MGRKDWKTEEDIASCIARNKLLQATFSSISLSEAAGLLVCHSCLLAVLGVAVTEIENLGAKIDMERKKRRGYEWMGKENSSGEGGGVGYTATDSGQNTGDSLGRCVVH